MTDGQMRAILFLAEQHMQRLNAECRLGHTLEGCTNPIAMAAKVIRDTACKMAGQKASELDQLIRATRQPLDEAADEARLEQFRSELYRYAFGVKED